MFFAGTDCPSHVGLCTELQQTMLGCQGTLSELLVPPAAVPSRNGCLKSKPLWCLGSSNIESPAGHVHSGFGSVSAGSESCWGAVGTIQN